MKKILLISVLCFSLLTSVSQASQSDTLDILHYDIQLTVYPGNDTIEGVATLTVIPKIAGIGSIKLDLQSLIVTGVRVNNNTAAFTHTGSNLLISSGAFSSMDTAFVEIEYRGKPHTESGGWGGGFYITNNYAYNIGVAFAEYPHNYGRVWFPCIDDFIDKATYSFHITTANQYDAVAGGVLSTITDEGNGDHTFHWNLNQEIPTYLASVAVGNYAVVRDTFSAINGNIPVEYYVYPADSLKAVASFAGMEQVFDGFEERYGPYQWEKVGFVQVPFSGGAMEHATNIALTDDYITGNNTYEWLFAHELSHHWFGNLITCSSAADMWINEGWATFSEFIYEENHAGQDHMNEYIKDMHKNFLQHGHLDDGGFFALSAVPEVVTYGSTSYDRGGLVAHSMRSYLGDVVFFDAIKALLQEYSFRSLSSDDFRDFLTDYTGIDMTGFFDGWVNQPGFLTYTVDSFSAVPSGGNFDVTVHIRQKIGMRETLTGSNRVEVTFMDANMQTETRLLEFSNYKDAVNTTLTIDPVIAMVDFNEKLCDGSLDHYTTVRTTGYSFFYGSKMSVSSITDSAFVRIEHKYVKPDPFKNTQYGIILSDRHYWKVDGILPSSMTATVQLEYINTINTGIDDELISSNLDPDTALLVMYRRDASKDWESVNFIKSGADNYGYAIVDSFRLGEYTLAVYDPLRYDSLGLGYSEIIPERENHELLVFPNPSDHDFQIATNVNENGLLRIFDLQGKQVFRSEVQSGNQMTIWTPGDRHKGIYIVELTDEHGTYARKKIIAL